MSVQVTRDRVLRNFDSEEQREAENCDIVMRVYNKYAKRKEKRQVCYSSLAIDFAKFLFLFLFLFLLCRGKEMKNPQKHTNQD